jgi:hypothetical protein
MTAKRFPATPHFIIHYRPIVQLKQSELLTVYLNNLPTNPIVCSGLCKFLSKREHIYGDQSFRKGIQCRDDQSLAV